MSTPAAVLGLMTGSRAPGLRRRSASPSPLACSAASCTTATRSRPASRFYEESRLYWHATGFGTDARIEPEKQEHFGITTCEAMSMGCVPIVIRRGGQPEIVEHGRSGYLWAGEDELERSTRRLIEDDGLRRQMAANVVERFEELVRQRER